MMTDSWAAIKKTKNLQMDDRVTCTNTQADALSIPVTSWAREDATDLSALDGSDQNPFQPHNLLKKLGTTPFRVFSSSHRD